MTKQTFNCAVHWEYNFATYTKIIIGDIFNICEAPSNALILMVTVA